MNSHVKIKCVMQIMTKAFENLPNLIPLDTTYLTKRILQERRCLILRCLYRFKGVKASQIHRYSNIKKVPFVIDDQITYDTRTY